MQSRFPQNRGAIFGNSDTKPGLRYSHRTEVQTRKTRKMAPVSPSFSERPG